MRTIFMVEDNEDHALLIRKGIEDGDCAVTHFRDGLEILKACDAMNGRGVKPGLIFLDLQLPGMDGFDVLKNLKQCKGFKHIPMVMLTTSCRKQEIEKAYQLGAAGYVVKSEEFGTLMTKLKQVKDYWFRAVELPHSQSAVKAGRV